MADQKLDNLLNLAMEATEEERAKSENLEPGYTNGAQLWDVVVKYSGRIEEIIKGLRAETASEINGEPAGKEELTEAGRPRDSEIIRAVPLLGDYAVVTLPREKLTEFAADSRVEFVEMPKRLYFEVNQGLEAGCFYGVQQRKDRPGLTGEYNNETGENPGFSGRGAEPGGENDGSSGETFGLTGRGVLVGIVDSGVDYRHPDFCNADGTTRILRLWDQTIPADQKNPPPEGYAFGVLYTEEDINRALALSEAEGRKIVPSRDLSGHGTSVLGIAAGNGRALGGIYRGAAYESSLLVVKLGFPRENSFPRTTELMQGIDYLIKESRKLGQPLALNLSFGNNYGSHLGDSLVEAWLSNAAGAGRTAIVVGSGNNGSDSLHTAVKVEQGRTAEVQLGVGERETMLNVQLWKSYADEIEISVTGPSGGKTRILPEQIGAQRYRIGDTELLIYYGKPGPFQTVQEIYFDFIPQKDYVDSGIWRFRLNGRKIKEGECRLWLPGGRVLNPGTGFYAPRRLETLTVPSTAARVITAGAYDSRYNAFAEFSGRGGPLLPRPKPDVVAPGVNITAPVPGGGYASVTGTSFAAPFVSGAAALLMEWGIVRQNDPFLWGEKVKAYLRRGARPLKGFAQYPSPEIGWGTLCLSESLPREK